MRDREKARLYWVQRVWSTTDMRVKLAHWLTLCARDCVWWELELRKFLCNIYGMNLSFSVYACGYGSNEQTRMNWFECVHGVFFVLRAMCTVGNFARTITPPLFFCLHFHFVCLSIFPLNLTHLEFVHFRIWYRKILPKNVIYGEHVQTPYRIHCKRMQSRNWACTRTLLARWRMCTSAYARKLVFLNKFPNGETKLIEVIDFRI